MTWAFFAASGVTGEGGVWMCAPGPLKWGRMAPDMTKGRSGVRPKSSVVIQMCSVFFARMRGCRPICIRPDPTGVTGLDRDRDA